MSNYKIVYIKLDFPNGDRSRSWLWEKARSGQIMPLKFGDCTLINCRIQKISGYSDKPQIDLELQAIEEIKDPYND